MGDYMIIIQYLPNTTTQEEINELRKQSQDKDITTIFVISGHEKLLDNLQSMINVD